jgi:pimeloyl-ACP methyl ester carboxylesterase
MIDVIDDLKKSIATKPVTKADHIKAWLDEALRALEIDRAAMAGISFGVWMAANYAMAFPDGVDRLALICLAGLVSSQHLRWMLRAYGATSFRPTEARLDPFLDTICNASGPSATAGESVASGP